MSYSLFKGIDFGIAGLTTVGYRLYNVDGSTNGSHITAGVTERAAGVYSADITFPNSFKGELRWDSGQSPTNKFASDFINPSDDPAVAGGVDLSPITAELDQIKAKTDLISSGGNITVLSPVSVSSGTISVRAGDSWSIPLSGLGNITSATKLWFSVNKPGTGDELAKIFIELAAGLTIVNGATYTPTSDGSITVTDAALGNLTVTVQEAATKLLAGSSTWTIKMLKAGDTKTLAQGRFAIAKYGVSAIT